MEIVVSDTWYDAYKVYLVAEDKANAAMRTYLRELEERASPTVTHTDLLRLLRKAQNARKKELAIWEAENGPRGLPEV